MKYSGIILWSAAILVIVGWALRSDAQSNYDEIIVNFQDEATAEDVRAIAEEYGLHLEFNSPFSKPEMLLRFVRGERAGARLLELIKDLTDEADIEYAEPNYVYQASRVVPDDPLYPQQWNLNMLDMEDAWDFADGTGAVVAVIDTGVAFEDFTDAKGRYHRVPDLAQTLFVQGYDFIDNDEHANDDNSHGTHVAGTIAQSTNNTLGVAGVAYKASIMPLKVLNRYGFGTISDIAEAVVYAADHGAHVINMSLGGGGESVLLREAIEYAHGKGVTIVCAAGNEGRDRASYPAAYPYAIGVASVGPEKELAPYSNYGKGVDLAAPGGNTASRREAGILQNTIGRMDPTTDGYEYFQGTSMASPHVAGVAALLVSLGIQDPDKIKEILQTSATDLADPKKYGAGLLNAAAAVRATQAEQSAPPEQALKTPGRLKESLLYFLAGIGFALWYFKLLKRSDGYGRLFSFLFSLALFLSSSGLFFVEWLPFSSFVPQSFLRVCSSSLPNLDRAVLGYSSAMIHPLLHSALVPVFLLLALSGNRKGKIVAIGTAVGLTGHLFVDTFLSLANVTFIPGTFFLDKAWLLLNGIICFSLALLAGKTR